MEGTQPEIERPPATGDVIWDMQQSSVLLENMVRSPHSLQIDDNNKLYVGVTDGIYVMNLKKIANRKTFTEGILDVNELLKKHFTKDSINVILNRFNKKAREGQERNYTTASMLMYKFKIGSIMESKLLMKYFRLSPSGLLPGNEPLIAVLLNIDVLILIGRVNKSFMEPYVPITNCNMSQESETDFPMLFNTHCFTWIEYNRDGTRLVFFFVYYEDVLEAWAFIPHKVTSTTKNIEFKSVIREAFTDDASTMTGNVNPLNGNIELLVSDSEGRIHKRTYEIVWEEDQSEIGSIKRTGITTFKTNFREIQFLSVLPSHLTPDDNYVRFVYGAQNHCFVGGFDEENSNDCVYSHNFPANLSELLYYENGIEFFFMDGTNIICDINTGEANTHRKTGIYAVFGASYSSTQVLKLLIGPPNYFALKTTNLLILSNVAEKTSYFDIIYQMSNKIITNLIKKEGKDYRLYYSRKPLNFSDVLMIFATNQINYRQFLKAYFATYDESLLDSKSKKKAVLKELLKGINSEIVAKFELTPEVKNHVSRVILLNLLYFAPEYFKDSVNKLMNKAILNFYSSMVMWYQEEAKNNTEIKNMLYIQKIRNYLRSEEAKDDMEVEEMEEVDLCPICSVKLSVKEAQCVNGHIVLRCLLSRKVIYFGDYYECKLCKQKYIKECLENYSRCKLDINFACTLCGNLLKKV